MGVKDITDAVGSSTLPWLDDKGRAILFTSARTANTFSDRPVGEEQLREIYELMKWGPTWANTATAARSSSSTSATLATVPGSTACPAWITRKPSGTPAPRPMPGPGTARQGHREHSHETARSDPERQRRYFAARATKLVRCPRNRRPWTPSRNPPGVPSPVSSLPRRGFWTRTCSAARTSRSVPTASSCTCPRLPAGHCGSPSWPTALTCQGAGPPDWSTSSSPTIW